MVREVWIITNDFRQNSGYGISAYLDQLIAMYSPETKLKIFTPDRNVYPLERITKGNLEIIRYYDRAQEYLNIINYNIYAATLAAETVLAELSIATQVPDYIEVQDCTGLGYDLLMAKALHDPRIGNIPIIVFAHTPKFLLNIANNEPSDTLDEQNIKQHEIMSYQMADAIICPSQFLADKLGPYIGNKNISIIPIPYEPYTQQYSAQRFTTDILIVARLEARKGILEFIAIMNELWNEASTLTVTIVGENYYYQEASMSLSDYLQKQYRTRFEEKRLQWIPLLPQSLVKDIMHTAKMIVIPSLFDNLPMVALEAMALGKTILISTSGGQSELILKSGTEGFLFSWENPTTIKTLITQILALSTTALATIGSAAQQRLQSYCGYTRIKALREQLVSSLPPAPAPNLLKRSAAIPVPPPLTEFEMLTLEKNNQLERIELDVVYTYNRQFKPGTLSIILIGNTAIQNIITKYQQLSAQISPSAIEWIGIQYGFEHKTPEIPPNAPLRIYTVATDQEAIACNTGARFATGEYICLLRDYEFISETFVTKATTLLLRNTALDICTSWLKLSGIYDDILALPTPTLPAFLQVKAFNSICIIRRNIYLNYGKRISSTINNYSAFTSILNLLLAECLCLSIPEPLTEMVVSNEKNPLTTHLLYKILRDTPELLHKLEKHMDTIFSIMSAENKIVTLI